MSRTRKFKIENNKTTCIICEKHLYLESFRWVPSKNHYRSQCKDCEKELREQYRLTPKFRFRKCKENAKNRDYDFNLSFKEFSKFENAPCFYCNDILDVIRLDRMNNQIGYTSENVVACCKMCNYMKRHHSANDFIDQCIKIASLCKAK